jgi:flagellar hook-basal body complex protein FliE
MKINGFPQIDRVKLSPELEKVLKSHETEKGDSESFGEMLANKIQQVDQFQKSADTASTDFATGKSRNLHEAVLAMEMADTSLRMLVTVRNKAIEAYQEIMKMPI